MRMKVVLGITDKEIEAIEDIQ
jgi:hypothetical protein